MAASKHYVAVDLGASGGRVVVAGWEGGRFALSEVHRFPNGPVRVHDTLQTDALGLWREVNEGIARAGRAGSGTLEAIGLDTWGVDFALLDRDGALVANPRHYRDKRTDGILEAAFERVPSDRIFEATGLQVWQINTLFQLFAMVRSGDAALEAARTLLPLPNLFYYWLGAGPCAEYTAATSSQCLNLRTRAWATDLIASFGIRLDLFPVLVEPGTQIGTLRDDLAADAGLVGKTRIVAVGSHDSASAVGAVPGLDANSAFISSGTWSVLGMEMPAPVVTPAALAAGFTNEGGLGGKSMLLKNLTGLWLVQECQRRWHQSGRDYGWQELLGLAERAEPFRSILDTEAPEFMSPDDMPEAIAAFCRTTGQPVPEDPGAIVRCCLESLALQYRKVVAELERLTGRSVDAIRIVGGGSRNQMLCQFAADACGVVVYAGPTEATALGNVMAQAIGAGELADVDEGRAAIANSIEVATYEPRETARWTEVAERRLRGATQAAGL